MVKADTAERATSLAGSRMDALDKTLVRDLGTVAQDLMHRGLYNSSIQVTEAKGAAERNLDQRAQVIAQSIAEVCTAHATRYLPSLPSDLRALFQEVYTKQLAEVRRKFEQSVPEQNKKLCPIRDFGPNVERHVQGLMLFAEGLKNQGRHGDNRFVHEIGAVAGVFVLILAASVLAARSVQWWMLPVCFLIAVSAFVIVTAVVLRRSGDISEHSFSRIVLAALDKVSQIRKPSSAGRKQIPQSDDQEDGGDEPLGTHVQ